MKTFLFYVKFLLQLNLILSDEICQSVPDIETHLNVNDSYASFHSNRSILYESLMKSASSKFSKFQELVDRVSSLEQPVWSICQTNDRWNSSCYQICTCFYEKKIISCWHHNLRSVPVDQMVPNDVKVIDLGMNYLKTLHKDTFKDLIYLQEIDMSHNRIRYLPGTIFHNLKSLVKIKLNNNRLKILSKKILYQLNNLKAIDLSNNLLTNLPSTLFHWSSNLVIFIAHGNLIRNLPATLFRGLSHLEEMDISKNRICGIEPEAFQSLVSLKYGKFDENNIIKLPEGLFSACQRVNIISLRKNQIVETNAILDTLSHLEYLDLSYNKITELNPDGFANATTMKELNLHHNQLQNISASLFRNLKNLQKLTLSANYLDDFPLERIVLENLSYLDLRFNMIRKLDEELFKEWKSLKIILLQGNMMKAMPQKILERFSNITYITLSNNMWNCDCDVIHFSEWLRNQRKTVKDLENVRCVEPFYMKKILIHEAESKDVCEPYENQHPKMIDISNLS